MNPAKKQAKKRATTSVAACLEIADPLERDKCIIQRIEQRIDNSIEETASDLRRDFKADLENVIDNTVMPALKSADENAIGAIVAYSGMVETVFRTGQAIDAMKDDISAIKRDMITKDDLKDFATKDDLKDFATKDEFNDLSSKVDGMDKKLDKLLEKK